MVPILGKVFLLSWHYFPYWNYCILNFTLIITDKCSHYSWSKKIFCKANGDHHRKSQLNAMQRWTDHGEPALMNASPSNFMHLWIREHCIRGDRKILGARISGSLLGMCFWTAICKSSPIPVSLSSLSTSFCGSLWKESFHLPWFTASSHIWNNRPNQLYLETKKPLKEAIIFSL